jgi:hypothetical protein
MSHAMKRMFSILAIFILAAAFSRLQSAGNIVFRGQLSGWANVNPAVDLPLWTGIRYLPRINFNIPFDENNSFDIELSSNISGSTGINPFDEFNSLGSIKPYRVWARWSSNRFEIRAGLQKINFGSATLVRPLMWFDQVDPRDPLQLTDGVWGVLGRYYFLNNMNIWVWGLYGNDRQKTWEIGETAAGYPEIGGRFQVPVPAGEAAFSYHHRKARIGEMNFGFSHDRPSVTVEKVPLKNLINTILSPAGFYSLESSSNGLPAIPEDRFGFDGRWDIGIGLWTEAAWFRKARDFGQLTNQHLFTTGMDYTFGIGNGIHMVIEQVLISVDRAAFRMENRHHFTAANANN